MEKIETNNEMLDNINVTEIDDAAADSESDQDSGEEKKRFGASEYAVAASAIVGAGTIVYLGIKGICKAAVAFRDGFLPKFKEEFPKAKEEAEKRRAEKNAKREAKKAAKHPAKDDQKPEEADEEKAD